MCACVCICVYACVFVYLCMSAGYRQCNSDSVLGHALRILHKGSLYAFFAAIDTQELAMKGEGQSTIPRTLQAQAHSSTPVFLFLLCVSWSRGPRPISMAISMHGKSTSLGCCSSGRQACPRVGTSALVVGGHRLHVCSEHLCSRHRGASMRAEASPCMQLALRRPHACRASHVSKGIRLAFACG